MSDSRLRVKQHGQITQVEFVDRNILDEANIQQIGSELAELIEGEAIPKLLINFTDVDHLSSAALGTLITVNNRIKNTSGELRLTNIDPQILEVFKITKLDQLFEIHDTVDEAMSSFGG